MSYFAPTKISFSFRRCTLSALALAFVCSVGLSTPAAGQELGKPENFSVERTDAVFRGSWSAVKGASFYQVWIEKFGRWSHNDKDMDFTPFTSSFQLPVEDERARFKVRAVGSQGQLGPFSEEVGSKRAATTPDSSNSTVVSNNAGTSAPRSTFDPKAPPPPPPTSLFAVWIEPDVIKLVWREPKGGKKYAVEEEVNEKWVSIPLLEFPRANTALIKNHPAPGPYRFRVRSIGSNGRASEPSFPTTAKR